MNQRKRVWSLLLAVLLLLSACQKSDPAPKEDTVPEKREEEQKEEEIPLEPVESFDPASYTNAMMLEDYDFFWTTLEENCATLGLMEIKRPLKIDQLKEEYRERVAAVPDGQAETFLRIMDDLNGKIRTFAHIQTVSPIVYRRYLDGDVWESDTQEELFTSPLVQGFYNWAESLPSVKKELEQVQETETVEDNSDYASNVLLSREGDTAIIQLKTLVFFGEEANQAVIKNLRDFCLENLDAQDFIIDITGNSGGNSQIWAEGLEPLWAGKTFTHREVAAYKLGDINVQMWDGWPENDPDVELKSISDLTAMDYPKLDMESLKDCDGVAIKTVVDDYTDVENPDGKEFEGRIWILIDGGVASSSELLVHFAKGNEPCTLVGTQSGGSSGGMTPPYNMDAAMPNCGMLVRYDPFYFINEDGICLELEGTHPDIEIGPDETPMQRCLEEIEKLQK